jgi:hypothetical protein
MKLRFENLLISTHRRGMQELLSYLESDTDFFTAPASSNYHGNYDGGLLEHSLHVYDHLQLLLKSYGFQFSNDESSIIIPLLHDICKINFYHKCKRGKRRQKENGDFELNQYGKPVWDDVEGYEIKDAFPIGHGEKSVIILQQFISLTKEEIFCIRWHMMSYDDSSKAYAGNLALTAALNLYPCISLVHCADLLSISHSLPKSESEYD